MPYLIRSLVSPAVAVVGTALSLFSIPVALATDWGEEDWKVTVEQDGSGQWWESMNINSVPGVLYTIEKSTDMVAWSTDVTYYGTGAHFVHPLFPTQVPTGSVPTGTPPVSTGPTTPFVPIILTKSAGGKAVLSWKSLDSGALMQYDTGVALGPIWNQFDGSYINPHGSYVMAISPQLTGVPSTSPNPTLATLDAAFVAAFVSALPTIESNVTGSVASAYSDTPTYVPGDRAFYRVKSNFDYDSDGDGIPDWRELLVYFTNPFNTDSNNNGIPDGNEPLIGAVNYGIPAPPPNPDRAPVARIRHISNSGNVDVLVNSFTGTTAVSGGGGSTDGTEWGQGTPQGDAIRAARSFGALKTAVDSLPAGTAWKEGAWSMKSVCLSDPNWGGSTAYTRLDFTEGKFQLKLDRAAPEGGYDIKVVFAQIFSSYDPATKEWKPVPAPVGQETISKTFHVDHNDDESASVDIVPPPPAVNQSILLIPGDVTILNASGADPLDGLCIKPGQEFKLDSDGINGDGTDEFVVETWWTWQTRRMYADGTFEEWKTVSNAAGPIKGHEITASLADEGIYQVRAKLTPTGVDPIYLPAIRMRNASNSIDTGGHAQPLTLAGTPEFLGVTRNDKTLAIRNTAVSWLGSTSYAYDARINMDPAGSPLNPNTTRQPKCNIWLAHMATSAGAPVPMLYRTSKGVFSIPTLPLAMNHWYSSPALPLGGKIYDLDSYNWSNAGMNTDAATPRKFPFPGMAVASSGTSDPEHPSGHCGVLDYDGSWINAGTNTVNKWIFIGDPDDDHYKPFRMRIYTGP